jgi:tetratricopeptide (TPR) repeat protein
MQSVALRHQLGLALALVTLVAWITVAAAQSIDQVDYWRSRHAELLPQDDARVTRAHDIFARLINAAGKRPGVVPRLLVIKNDPWGISLPIALPDGWIILSRGVLDTCYREPAHGDDRLAFVLGHEIAHQLKDDFWHLKFFHALAAAKAQQPQQRQPLAEVEAFFRAPQEERPAQELRADEHGIIYATMAGFNPQAVVAEDPQTNFFQDWIQARAPRQVGLGLSASSHPNPPQRAAALRAHLQQIADKVSVFEVGLWFYYAGDYAKAVRAFEQFLAFFPSREVYHNLAVSHHQLALQAYQVWQKDTPVLPFHLSLRLDPLTRANEVFLGRLLTAERSTSGTAQPAALFRQHLQQAITFYREALAHDETYVPAATNLGCALLVRGVRAEGGVRHADIYEAVATLQRALERAPNVPALLNNLAVALFYVDQVPRARAHLTQARTFAPDYAAPAFNLAYIAQTEKRQAEAQQYQRDYEQLVSRPATARLAPSQGMEHVLGLGIGSVVDQIPLTWGSAVRQTFRLEAMPFTVASYHGQTQTLARDGEILMIFVRQGYRGESARGITIGSGAEDVLGRYGPPTRRLETTQGQSWSYDAQRIAFQLHQGRVVSWLLF